MPKEKIKILLVEDDSFLLSVYAGKFEQEGFEVITAMDGEKAVRLALKEKPSIIILDILLPKLNGLEAARELKKNPAIAKTPIILLTNLSQNEEIQQGLKLGIKDYIIKAHSMPAEVVEKTKKILQT